jgi:hypothetical protein
MQVTYKPQHLDMLERGGLIGVEILCILDLWTESIRVTDKPKRWPRGLRRGPAAARLLGLRVRILPGEWISFYCKCCVLSGTCLSVGLITRPEEFYCVLCV